MLHNNISWRGEGGLFIDLLKVALYCRENVNQFYLFQVTACMRMGHRNKLSYQRCVGCSELKKSHGKCGVEWRKICFKFLATLQFIYQPLSDDSTPRSRASKCGLLQTGILEITSAITDFVSLTLSQYLKNQKAYGSAVLMQDFTNVEHFIALG